MKIFTNILLALLLIASIGAWILSTQGIYRLNTFAAWRTFSFVIAKGELAMMWWESAPGPLAETRKLKESPIPALELMGGKHKAGFRYGQASLLGNVPTRWVGTPLWAPTLLLVLIAWKKYRRARLEGAKSEPVKNLQPQPPFQASPAPAP